MNSFPLPTLYTYKFGQNPPTGSEDRVRKKSYADRINIITNMPPPPSFSLGT